MASMHSVIIIMYLLKGYCTQFVGNLGKLC